MNVFDTYYTLHNAQKHALGVYRTDPLLLPPSSTKCSVLTQCGNGSGSVLSSIIRSYGSSHQALEAISMMLQCCHFHRSSCWVLWTQDIYSYSINHVGWNMSFPNTYPQSPETAKLQHKWFPRYPHLHPPIFAFPTLSCMWVHGDRFSCPVTWHTSFPILCQHHTTKPGQSIHWFPTNFNWKPPCIDFTPTISIITLPVLHQIEWGLVHWNLLENVYKMVYNTCSNHQKQQGQLSPYHRFHISQLGNHHQIT